MKINLIGLIASISIISSCSRHTIATTNTSKSATGPITTPVKQLTEVPVPLAVVLPTMDTAHNNKDSIVRGSWQIKSVAIPDIDERIKAVSGTAEKEQTAAAFKSIREGFKDIKVSFDTDGSYTASYGGTNDNGTWQIAAGTLTAISKVNGSVNKYDVSLLTGDQMTLVRHEAAGFSVILNFSRK